MNTYQPTVDRTTTPPKGDAMDAKEHAKQLFQSHYMIVHDIDSDMSGECLISILAIQHAKVSAMQIGNEKQRRDVMKELEKL